MHIGGLQKNSLIDYPGKISCVLFLTGCNFTCPYCHNPDLVHNKNGASPFATAEQMDRFFDSRRTFLDGVVISGGEPTLHPQLTGLCERIKAHGYPVKLDTNGSRPEVIRSLIDGGLVDYVAMDIKTDPFAYWPRIQKTYEPDRILESIRIVMESAPAFEFRTTCVKPFVNPAVIETIGRLIRGAGHYVLQRFRDTVVLCPEFFHNFSPALTDSEMQQLQTAASPYVQRCSIR
jgi:pyruvate formate lyase activating enzyme